MDARHLNLIPAFTGYSDTYSVDYGRAAGWIETGAEALADAVVAYLDVTRLARTRPNSPAWRKACQRHHAASRRYATITGLTMPKVAAKVRAAAEILDAA